MEHICLLNIVLYNIRRVCNTIVFGRQSRSVFLKFNLLVMIIYDNFHNDLRDGVCVRALRVWRICLQVFYWLVEYTCSVGSICKQSNANNRSN